MTSLLMPDLTIAFGLIGIAVIVFLLSRMGVLPKKSLPYVAAALVGVFGLVLFRKSRERGLRNRLKEEEERLEALEERANATRVAVEEPNQQLDEALFTLQQRKEATQKEILLIRAENEKKKQEIENLSRDEVFIRFAETFGSQ